MLVHVLSVLAFIGVTFAVQGLSHFVLNKAHYDSVGILRSDIIMPLGFATMIIQGLVMSLVLQQWQGGSATLQHGLLVAAAFGIFLGAYMALTEAAKYDVPSIFAWIRSEVLSSTIQFAVFGLALGRIHRTFGT